MKTLNLFLKMHFTSLSPDSNNISLAIISDCNKSIYCEFTDFDINRCDNFVKKNILEKLESKNEIGHAHLVMAKRHEKSVFGKTELIKEVLNYWLSANFSDYKLNFIVDCGWFTWGKFVELMAEWEEFSYKDNGIRWADNVKIGIPKLPANFPPVPQDLNELIALKKGISVSEAFELDREEIASGIHSSILCSGGIVAEDGIHPDKFNALWDAKVTKSIWERLQ